MIACGYCGLPVEFSTEYSAWVHRTVGHIQVLTALGCPQYAKGKPARPYRVLEDDQIASMRLAMPRVPMFDGAWWADRMKR
jgi:hypothetical protein